MSFNVIWLRNDLRLHDNAGFSLARHAGLPVRVVFVVPPYWLDSRHSTPLSSHYLSSNRILLDRLGLAKSRFLRACLIDLQRQLALQNIDFKMVYQQPEALFSEWHKQGMQQLFTHFPQAPEEAIWIENIRKSGISTTLYDNQTLFDQKQMAALFQPWPVSFSAFRRKLETSGLQPHKPAPPISINEYPDHFDERLPSIPWHNDFYRQPNDDIAFRVIGGEHEGLAHLSAFIWQARGLEHYKSTRNQLCGSDFSSKFSAHLSWGALSIRKVWHEVEQWEQQQGSNEHSQWFKQELLWREFFHWSMRQHGKSFFQFKGLKQDNLSPPQFSLTHWQRWCDANTGVPMVDAGLRELIATGYCSNRMRQNMASFFIQSLKLDWRLGAAFFEHHLVDYDVASNWGNWAYLAGTGQDPRSQPGQGRRFDINFQLERHDPQLTHIHRWLPELRHTDLKAIQRHTTGESQLDCYIAPIVTLTHHSPS